MPSILRQLAAAAKGRMFAAESFSGSDFGFRIGKVIFKIGDGLKTSRRRIRRWLRSPALARRMTRFRQSVKKRAWTAALEQAREIATLAEAARDARLMEEMGIALSRLGDYGRSARLRLESRRLTRGADAKEWSGEDVPGTLLVNFVENEAQGMGGTLQYGRLVAEAAKHAKRCIALIEPRLAPLFGRSFASVDVRAASPGYKTAAYAEADRIAGFEHVNAYCGADAEAIAALLASVDAKFVSLQYGKVTGELARLAAGSRKTIINDASVDQLANMDRFAAQIASLDAVVTISNTGAHLTGALGVPMIVIIDDNFRRIWPVGTDRTPYYPAATIVAKNGRGWEAAMKQVATRLGETLANRRR